MHHIVNMIADHFTDEEIFKAPSAAELLEKQKLFTEKPIDQIFDFTKRNPFHHVHSNDSLLVAIKALANSTINIRRSLVFKDGTDVYDHQQYACFLYGSLVFIHIN